MSTHSHSHNPTGAALHVVVPRPISNRDGLQAFNALFADDHKAAAQAAFKLKTHWHDWATAFDAQWFTPTENSAKILVGKKLAEAVEQAKAEVAQVIQQALEGQQVRLPIALPVEPVNNEAALQAFQSIFQNLAMADQAVNQLVGNWERWAPGLGGQNFEISAINAKLVAGRVIAHAITAARMKVADAIRRALNGDQITGNHDKLEQAKNRRQVFEEFLHTEITSGANASHLAFLDRGIQKSPYKQDIQHYPDRLKQKPETQQVISTSKPGLAHSQDKQTFSLYPKLGNLPEIDQQGLKFLHQDIQEACVCLGRFVDGQLQTRWLGRNPLQKAQFWSATKIIPLLNVVCQVNAKFPHTDIDQCVIRDPEQLHQDISFHELATDIISYEDGVDCSNSSAAVAKRFGTLAGLEQWLKKITGNHTLEFCSYYGPKPFIQWPQLYNPQQQKVLLKAPAEGPRGANLVSAYDMTRILSMLGWHHHLPQSSRLPNAQWHSLESIIRAMGTDSARYADVAIARLGLETVISSPVILSKLGHGYSEARKTVETTYVALVQFLDKRSQALGQLSNLRSVSLTLRGVKVLQDTNHSGEAVELDARMAAEVTEIVRRVVTEMLA